MNKASFLVVMMIVGLGGCDRIENRQDRSPELVWHGYLAELDDQPVTRSGITLEIYRDPHPLRAGALRYEISTGCRGSGRVSEDGSLAAYENLRPCRVEDAELVGRVVGITGPGLPSPASGQRLTWTKDTAELSSSEGKARFMALR